LCAHAMLFVCKQSCFSFMTACTIHASARMQL
jgi:hypothetical protein